MRPHLHLPHSSASHCSFVSPLLRVLCTPLPELPSRRRTRFERLRAPNPPSPLSSPTLVSNAFEERGIEILPLSPRRQFAFRVFTVCWSTCLT